MTQMLLFDAPVGFADAAVLPVTDSESSASAVQVMERPNPVKGREKGRRTSLDSLSPSGDSEVHRMGDLARLVLLRYDLMAQRRARYSARRHAR